MSGQLDAISEAIGHVRSGLDRSHEDVNRLSSKLDRIQEQLADGNGRFGHIERRIDTIEPVVKTLHDGHMQRLGIVATLGAIAGIIGSSVVTAAHKIFG